MKIADLFVDIIPKLDQGQLKTAMNTAASSASAEVKFTTNTKSIASDVSAAATKAAAAASRDIKFTADTAQATREVRNIADAADEVGSASSQAAGGIGDLGGAIALAGFPALGGAMELAGTAIMGVTGAADLANLAASKFSKATLISTATTVKDTVVKGISTVATTALSAATTALGVAVRFALGPVGLIIGALTLLAGGMVLAYKKSDTFRAMVDRVWAVIKTAVAWLGQFIGKLAAIAVPAAIGLIKSGIDKLWSATKTAVGWVANFVGGIAKIVVPGAIDLIRAGIQATWGHIKTAWEWTGKFIDKLKDFKLPGWVTTLKDMFSNLGTKAKNAIDPRNWFGDGPGIGGTPEGKQPRGVQEMMAALPAGTRLISGYRPGAITATGKPSYHGKGRAVDIPPSMALFNYIRTRYPNSKELIFSPAGDRQIHNGKPHYYTGVTRKNHFDHVHWALARGGKVTGPGSGTSDSILARLSNGEFVINAKSAAKLGYENLMALNKYATGGPVTRATTPRPTTRVQQASAALASGGIEALNKLKAAWEDATRAAQQHKEELNAFGDVLTARRAYAAAKGTEAKTAALKDLRAAELAYNTIRSTERERKEGAAIDALVDKYEALKKAKEDALAVLEEKKGALNALLDQQQAVFDKMAESVTKRDDALAAQSEAFIQQVAEFNQREVEIELKKYADLDKAARAYTETVKKTLADRSRALQIDAKGTFQQSGFANSLGSITNNLSKQTGQIQEYGGLVKDALARGFDSSMLDALGIDGPEDIAQLRQILKATQAEIDAFRTTYNQRIEAANAQAALEQERGLGQVGEALRAAAEQYETEIAGIHAEATSALKTLAAERLAAITANIKAVSAIHKTFRDEQRALVVELGNIGRDQGRTLGEAIALGLRSSVPAIQEAARAAQAAASVVASQGGNTGMGPGAAAERAAYDAQYRAKAAAAAAKDPLERARLTALIRPLELEYQRIYDANRGKIYDQGGWLMPGQTGTNRGSQPEAVLTPAQSEALVRIASGDDYPEWARDLVSSVRTLVSVTQRTTRDMVTLKRTGAV